MILKISDLQFSYDEKKMFEHFSLTLEKGERVALMGDSGCGKSTLVRLVLGFLKPKGGNISCTSKLSVDFQDNRLFENATVYENIACTRTLSKDYLEEVLREFQLGGFCDYKVKELSGGMKRRVAFIRALLYRADLYIWDESVREVELKTRKAMLQGIEEFTKNQSILYITHNREDLRQLQIDRLLKMERREDGIAIFQLV